MDVRLWPATSRCVRALGDTAALLRVGDEASMAASILRLNTNKNYRDRLEQLGLENDE